MKNVIKIVLCLTFLMSGLIASNNIEAQTITNEDGLNLKAERLTCTTNGQLSGYATACAEGFGRCVVRNC